MSITFTIYTDKGYFLSKYEDRVSDDELLHAYQEFYSGDKWQPKLNELVDVSDVDVGKITANGLRRVAEYTKSVLREHGLNAVKLAIYAPHDLPFGLARMYEAFTEESPESVHVFRDLVAAKRWLESEE
jgi:hypothetical protein